LLCCSRAQSLNLLHLLTVKTLALDMNPLPTQIEVMNGPDCYLPPSKACGLRGNCKRPRSRPYSFPGSVEHLSSDANRDQRVYIQNSSTLLKREEEMLRKGAPGRDGSEGTTATRSLTTSSMSRSFLTSDPMESLIVKPDTIVKYSRSVRSPHLIYRRETLEKFCGNHSPGGVSETQLDEKEWSPDALLDGDSSSSSSSGYLSDYEHERSLGRTTPTVFSSKTVGARKNDAAAIRERVLSSEKIVAAILESRSKRRFQLLPLYGDCSGPDFQQDDALSDMSSLSSRSSSGPCERRANNLQEQQRRHKFSKDLSSFDIITINAREKRCSKRGYQDSFAGLSFRTSPRPSAREMYDARIKGYSRPSLSYRDCSNLIKTSGTEEQRPTQRQSSSQVESFTAKNSMAMADRLREEADRRRQRIKTIRERRHLSTLNSDPLPAGQTKPRMIRSGPGPGLVVPRHGINSVLGTMIPLSPLTCSNHPSRSSYTQQSFARATPKKKKAFSGLVDRVLSQSASWV